MADTPDETPHEDTAQSNRDPLFGEHFTPTGLNIETLHLDGGAVDKIAALGRDAAGGGGFTVYTGHMPGMPDAVPILFLHGPNGATVKNMRDILEPHRLRPERRSGTAKVDDLASFIALTNRHKTDDSIVFACSDWKKPSLTAVIDYHEAVGGGFADNGKHRIRYEFPFSEEWEKWAEHNQKSLSQEEFAEFLEDRLVDVCVVTEAEQASFQDAMHIARLGTPSELATITRELQVNVSSEVKQAVNLGSGEGQVVFKEDHSGADGQPVKVPGGFILEIPLFRNGDPIHVPVRLRYRLRSGKIFWSYSLFRGDRVIAEAVDHAKRDVAAGTELQVIDGAPEMSA